MGALRGNVSGLLQTVICFAFKYILPTYIFISQFSLIPPYTHTKTDPRALNNHSLQFHPPNTITCELHYYKHQNQHTLLPAPKDITTTDPRDYGPITCN